MASLHKDPRGKSPYYYCAYTLADGTRKFRSTRKKKEQDAWKVANTWADAANDVGSNQRDLQLLNEMRAARGHKPIHVPTVEGYLTDWLETQKLHLSPSTQKRYGTSIRKLLAFLGVDAKNDLQSLTAEHIEGFIRHEQAQGLAAKTLNLDLKALKAALGKAHKRGYLLLNVAGTVDTQANDSAERKAFTKEQIRKILNFAEPEWRGLVLVAYYTGLRLGDAARLRWSNINFDRKSITVVPDKRALKSNRPPHEIPVHDQLLGWLREWKGKSKVSPLSDDDSVFQRLSKKPTRSRGGLSNTFTRLLEKAGIENFEVKAAGEGSNRGRSVMAYGFHSLRSSFNTELQAVGVSEEVRMKLSDHTSREVNRGYTKTEFERLTSELSKLGEI